MGKDKRTKDSIDFVEILRIIRKELLLLLIISILAAVFGALVAITTPNLYTASSTMIPQITDRSETDNLTGLASMAGISLGNKSSWYALPPKIYPRIAYNTNFIKELIYSSFNISGNDVPITLIEYANDEKYRKFSLKASILKYTVGLPGVVLSLFMNKRESVGGEQGKKENQASKIQSYTSQERKALAMIRRYLRIIYNQKDGTIKLTATMPEPLAAAQLAQRAQELLQKYLADFIIAKAVINMGFIDNNYIQAKQNFEAKQAELSRFRDANKSFSSAVARTYEERLVSEYSLLLGLYTELSRQRAKAKIAIKETTPLLTVLEPVVLPITKSSPNRLKIILLLAFAAFFAGVLRIVIVHFIRKYFK